MEGYLHGGALVAEGRVEEGADGVHEHVRHVVHPRLLRTAQPRSLVGRRTYGEKWASVMCISGVAWFLDARSPPKIYRPYQFYNFFIKLILHALKAQF